MPDDAKSPTTYADLQAAIARRHADLSPRLRQIAEFALANPNDMALETVATVAERAGVQSSALIRFAKTMGFDGFSDMQRVFRGRLTDGIPTYSERLRARGEGEPDSSDAGGVLDHFVSASICALEHLRQEIDRPGLEQAVELMRAASRVYVVGQRRSFPVATYLAYALGHLGRPVILVDGVGGMTRQQASNMTDADVLLAISFKPYAPETLEVCRAASNYGVPILAITDGTLSPLVPLATAALTVDDAQLKGVRALSATMCLAVAMVVALGQRLDGRRLPV